MMRSLYNINIIVDAQLLLDLKLNERNIEISIISSMRQCYTTQSMPNIVCCKARSKSTQ